VGLDTSSVMFLCAAKSLGVDFTTTAMIGRQTFWPDGESLRRIFEVCRIADVDPTQFIDQHYFADAFFRLLGATEVASVDVSSYEGASIIHDMNQPVPPELHEKFSCVHDGGTIEHVFNIPQAFKNCMQMVKVGGHFTQVNVANNFAGHGFWQFSPELIFGVFGESNGFAIEAVLMHEVVPGGAWYLVSNPDEVRQRVELCNDAPTYILTIARRISSAVELFSRPPQQSDYVALWDRAPRPAKTVGATAGPPPWTWKRYVPQPLKRSIKSFLRQHFPDRTGRPSPGHVPFSRGFDPKVYRRIDEESLLRGSFRR